MAGRNALPILNLPVRNAPVRPSKEVGMIVAIRVRQSPSDGAYESVRLVEVAATSELFAELAATARHYTRVRHRRHRATAWTSSGKVLATVSMSPDAVPFDE